MTYCRLWFTSKIWCTFGCWSHWHPFCLSHHSDGHDFVVVVGILVGGMVVLAQVVSLGSETTKSCILSSNFRRWHKLQS